MAPDVSQFVPAQILWAEVFGEPEIYLLKAYCPHCDFGNYFFCLVERESSPGGSELNGLSVCWHWKGMFSTHRMAAFDGPAEISPWLVPWRVDELEERNQPERYSKPTRRLVNRALIMMRDSARYKCFFECLDNPEWLEPLWESGFFRYAPEPISEGDRTVFPVWHEAGYLARMASRKPALVSEIIRGIKDAGNVSAVITLVEALLSIPAWFSGRLYGKVMRWARYTEPELQEKLRFLVDHWAEAGMIDLAMSLLSKLH